MAMKVFADNTTLPASDINEYLVNVKYAAKPAGTTRTGTTPSADPDLAVTIDASKSYLLDVVLPMQGGAGGVKWNFSGSGSNHLYGTWQDTANGGIFVPGGIYDGGITNDLATTLNISSLGGQDVLVVRGVLVTGASSGTLNFNWSMNSASGNLTISAGAFMLLRRVA